MEIAKLGPKRDRQIGTLRGESPTCTWGRYSYSNGCECREVGCEFCYKPYSSEIGITMELIEEEWDINLYFAIEGGIKKWCCEIVLPDIEWRVSVGVGDTPTMALIDAITKASIMVKGREVDDTASP